MFRDAKLFWFFKKWETKLNVSLKLEAGECSYKLRFGNLGKFRGLNAINQNIILFAVCVLFYFWKIVLFIQRSAFSTKLIVSILKVLVKKHLGKNEADEREAEEPWQWDPQKRVVLELYISVSVGLINIQVL